MKHKFLHEDDSFDAVGNEIYANFAPWLAGNAGNPSGLLQESAFFNQGSAPTSGASLAGSTIAVTTGGITINLVFDAAAMAAPDSFRAGIVQAATILAQTISDRITVNLAIDYSGTGGGAAAGPDHGLYESYSLVRADLISHATPGDITFNALPSGSSIQGQSNVAVWNAELKLWGLLGANDATTDDGSATFATDINPNLLVGVALHELTHALGRVPYGSQPDVFDLFRFTSRARICSPAASPPRRLTSRSTEVSRNLPTWGAVPIRATSSTAACKGPTIPSMNITTDRHFSRSRMLISRCLTHWDFISGLGQHQLLWRISLSAE